MGEHAKLSPSAAKRWKACPASVKESENVVNVETEHSLKGTAVHWAFAEMLMGNEVPPGTKAPNGVELTTDLLEIAGEGVGWVRGRIALEPDGSCSVAVEERVQIGTYFGLEPTLLFGTCDCRIMTKTTLVVFDLKGGWVDVQAENNEQLLLYAGGLAEELGWLWDEYELVICQPKQGEPKVWVITREELQKKLEEFREPIANALSENPRYGPTEEGCRFCAAAARCVELNKHALELARQEFQTPAEIVERITLEQMVELLNKADLIRGVLAAIENHALGLIQVGQDVPGYKAVEGKKNRVWKTGVEEMVKAAAYNAGKTEDQIAPRKLLTPAQAEKLLGKQKTALEQYITKPAGEPRLAKVDDTRPALPPHFTAVDDIV